MKASKKAAFTTMVIFTVCNVLINLANLLEYMETGTPGGTISTICFLAADVCMVIAWIDYFRKKKAE